MKWVNAALMKRLLTLRREVRMVGATSEVEDREQPGNMPSRRGYGSRKRKRRAARIAMQKRSRAINRRAA